MPTQSKMHAQDLFITPDISVTEVQVLGWYEVRIEPSSSEIIFTVLINGHYISYEEGMAGYDFLSHHFHAQVTEIENEWDKHYC